MTEKIKRVFESAKWITAHYLVDNCPTLYKAMSFRKDYHLKDVPNRCLLNIAAFHSCVLFINGERVYDSHIRFFVKHARYDTIDIAPYLKKGRNAFAVVLKSPTGSSGYGENSGPCFILCSEGIGEEKIKTDSTWYVRSADWYGFSNLMISVPTVFQEHYNTLVKEPIGWKTNLMYKKWRNSFVLGSVDVPPFVDMSPRDIPFLKEESYEPKLVWSGKGNREKKNVQNNLARLFNQENLCGERILPRNVNESDNLEEHIFTFDFGKTGYIRPGLSVIEQKGEVRLECYYALRLGSRPEAYRGFGDNVEGFVDTFTPNKNCSEWSALSPKGFRFMTVKITGSGYVKFKPMCKMVVYPYGEAKSLQIKDDLLQRIWETGAETLRSATNDVIVDTVTRENMLWSFDSLIACKAAYYTFGELSMWRRCLLLVAEGTEKNGNFKTVVPSGSDTYAKLVDQNLYWARSCYEYYEVSGDTSLLRVVAPKIYGLLAMCRKHITAENLFSPPEFCWHWIDWAAIDRRPYSLAINCILLNAAEAAYKIADVISMKKLQILSKEITDTIRPATEKFYDEERKFFVAHIDPVGSIPPHNTFGFLQESELSTVSIHAMMLACGSKCGTEEMRQRTAAFVAELIETQDIPEILMGPGWTELLLCPLFDYGYGKQALTYIKKHFGNFIALCAPTFGETFGEKEPFNTAHAWGSAINTLLMIKQKEIQRIIML